MQSMHQPGNSDLFPCNCSGRHHTGEPREALPANFAHWPAEFLPSAEFALGGSAHLLSDDGQEPPSTGDSVPVTKLDALSEARNGPAPGGSSRDSPNLPIGACRMMPATCSCVSSFRFCPAGKNVGLTALPRTRFCATSEPETGRSGSGSLRRRCRRTPSTARMRCHCSPAISKNGVPLWAPAAWMRMRTRVKVPGIFARAASGSLAVMRPRARPACGGQLNPPPPSSSPQRSCCHQDGDAGSRAPAAGPSCWRARPRHRSPPPHSRPD